MKAFPHGFSFYKYNWFSKSFTNYFRNTFKVELFHME